MLEPALAAIVNLAKKRGFVFQASEIYGGLRSAYPHQTIGNLYSQHPKRGKAGPR